MLQRVCQSSFIFRYIGKTLPLQLKDVFRSAQQSIIKLFWMYLGWTVCKCQLGWCAQEKSGHHACQGFPSVFLCSPSSKQTGINLKSMLCTPLVMLNSNQLCFYGRYIKTPLIFKLKLQHSTETQLTLRFPKLLTTQGLFWSFLKGFATQCACFV